MDKLQNHMINKGLEINMEKSQVLKIWGGTREEMAWKFKDVSWREIGKYQKQECTNSPILRYSVRDRKNIYPSKY